MNGRPLVPYVSDHIWLCLYPVKLGGTGFDARMTVIRLTTGELMLHSPCEITPELSKQLSAFGSVRHIVAPGNFHTTYVASAQAAFPSAKTWICPGIERRRPFPEIRRRSWRRVPPRVEWRIDQVLVQGTRITREVAMFHRASRTLILVDLIENFTDATPHVRGALKFWFKYIFGLWDHPRPAPEYRLGWKNRRAAAESLQRILAWDFNRIILAHGELVDRNAHDIATAAWSGVLE